MFSTDVPLAGRIVPLSFNDVCLASHFQYPTSANCTEKVNMLQYGTNTFASFIPYSLCQHSTIGPLFIDWQSELQEMSEGRRGQKIASPVFHLHCS